MNRIRLRRAVGDSDLLDALREAPELVRVDAPALAGGPPVAVVAEGAAEDSLRAHLAQVRDVFDQSFAGDSELSPTFDITGWVSGISREAFAPAVMQRWVDTTVAALRSFAPRSVLEIGCGTGLLLTRLAPDTDRYVGTDMSAVVLDRLRDNLRRAGLELDHVVLEQRAADDVAGLDGGFDLVVLNSVAQYFPSADYLAEVIDRAAALLAPGGAVFVGDVRDLRLLGEYHRSAARHQGAAGLSEPELERDAARREAEEPELVLDPRFFHSLAERPDRPMDVDVRTRSALGDDELMHYRYDVVLTPRAASPRDSARTSDPARDVSPTSTNPARGRVLRELRRTLSAEVTRKVPGWGTPVEVRVVGPSPLPVDGAILLLDPDAADVEGSPSGDVSRDSGSVSVDEVRTVLHEAWQELLALDAVADDDDFFDLGGHSLLATQLAARLRGALAVDVPLAELMHDPGFAQMVDAVLATARAQGVATETIEREQTTDPVLRRQPSGSGAGLSFAQERLWFLAQRDPESRAYHVPYGVPWRGPLDMDVLRRALSAVIERHEALRTRFVVADGIPWQVPVPAAAVDIELADASSWSCEAVEAAVSAFAREPFDLTSGVLFRARVFRRGPDDHLLVLALHHIAADGWSMRILFGELEALYEAFAAGETSPLAPLALQYADFAVWQREWMAGPRLDAQLDYWRTALAGAPDLLALPAARPRPAAPSGAGALLRTAVDRELTDAVRALARDSRTTLFTVLLAAFGVVLSQWSGRDDLVVGTPVANRPSRDLEGLVGFFVNTLPLRVDVSGDPDFAIVLDRVRDSSLGAFGHQDAPFDAIVSALAPERVASHAPLVQVVLALQNTEQADSVVGVARPAAGSAAAPLADLRFTEVELDKGSSKFELTLSFEETTDGGLLGLAEYDSSVYDEASIARLVSHLVLVLEAAAADPGLPVSRLPILTPAERDLLVECGTGPAPGAPEATTIHELVGVRARATPDAPAVVVAGTAGLSYRELDDRAGALAERLRASGVRPGAIVGVCLPRGADVIVAMLATLRAGAAYLPLDPQYPRERLELMTTDAGVRTVVTTANHADALSTDLTLVPIDTAIDTAIDTPEASVTGVAASYPSSDDPDGVAYVVYTSGSTGTPKGVAVPHRAVVNLVTSPTYCDIRAQDRVAQAATPNFDAFTFEVWAALTAGAAVVVIEADDVLDPGALAATIERIGITTMFLTTSVFDLVARSRPDAFAPLRTLLFGGEAVDPRSVAAVLDAGGPGRLVHVYGPTETTTFASSHDVCREDVAGGVIPIGLPLQGVTMHVLDRHLRPVPAGVVGDLYIGGSGLALGYLGAPELTARAFPSAPVAATSDEAMVLAEGTRLYRTGDRASRQLDGRLVFAGREDRQVKVRGYRIELDEVEAAVEQLEQVAAAAVVHVRGATSGSRIVAYVVPASGAEAHGFGDLLLGDLKRRLPAYMLPHEIVLLDALPLGSTGKVDLRTLPEPGDPQLDSSTPEPVAPRDDIERGIVEIWSGLLDRRDFGVEDDFFALGGHSLLVSRMISGVRSHFAVELPMRAGFEHPTIAELAIEVLVRMMAGRDGDAVTMATSAGARDGRA